LREDLARISREMQRLEHAGVFAEQTPYGPNSSARRSANYFDERFAESYRELSAAIVSAWLDEATSDFLAAVFLSGKGIADDKWAAIADDHWAQCLRKFGMALSDRCLAVIADATPMSLHPIVNRAEFQRRHVKHIQEVITAKIEFLRPHVPLRDAPATPIYDTEPGLGGDRPSSSDLDPVPADQRRMDQRREYVLPRLKSKGWHTIEKWAEEIEKLYPGKVVSERTLYNYLAGTTDPHRRTRLLMAGSLGVKESELPS
jgi:hypothetical protein